MGAMIEFKRPDGQSTAAYFADAGAAAPGLVLIQEWWGLNEHIRSVADRFAQAGFSTLAPDLYRGRLASSGEEANHLMTGLDFADATHQDLRGAAQHLHQGGRAVGVLGFCMGGALTISAAVHVPELAAAVCFYGIPPLELADPARIRVPLQGHFAQLDDWCTPAAAADLAQRMQGAGLQPELHHYAADHAFFNNARPEVFDAAAAALAFERSTAFLRQHLR
ncbi:dienelactone hydrolase family protein [Roseateles sp. BYS180W]|uniref:Dienelactone hydrolase family protein n=1 Tax=Roseateles rivi TaxID=3299028 RepID=A0ABW7FX25_9BURK